MSQNDFPNKKKTMILNEMQVLSTVDKMKTWLQIVNVFSNMQ